MEGAIPANLQKQNEETSSCYHLCYTNYYIISTCELLITRIDHSTALNFISHVEIEQNIVQKIICIG